MYGKLRGDQPNSLRIATTTHTHYDIAPDTWLQSNRLSNNVVRMLASHKIEDARDTGISAQVFRGAQSMHAGHVSDDLHPEIIG